MTKFFDQKTEVLFDAAIPIPFGLGPKSPYQTREELVDMLLIYLKRSLMLQMIERRILPSGRWEVLDDEFMLSLVGYGWDQGEDAFRVWSNAALAEHLFSEFGLDLPEQQTVHMQDIDFPPELEAS